MEINDKKLKRTGLFINWAISIVLMGFLISLSNLIIRDLDTTVPYPNYQLYVDQPTIDKISWDNNALEEQIDALSEVIRNYETMRNLADESKNAEQESFDNWIKTRSTIGSPAQDKEVLRRTMKIDEYRSIALEWKQKCDSIQSQVDVLFTEVNDNEQKKDVIISHAGQGHRQAVKKHDLKVFLIRLLFVAPILALGIFFFIRYRNHRFKALFLGFTLFSVYAFFVGLVPYLPDYGGYIRYVVGILLTVGLGYYAIKYLKDYSDKKRAELNESTTKRAMKLQNEISERAFNNHVCPSCGKDFFLKPWEAPSQLNKQNLHTATDFCRYCGLQLVKTCGCGQRNYAHLPYCITCGDKIKEVVQKEKTTPEN